MKVVVTILGSDSSGGSGIQADLRSISANGGFGASIVTTVTAQNTVEVTMSQEIAPAMIDAQLDAVFSDIRVAAVKTGMLSSEQVIETVASALQRHRPAYYVLDPVIFSRSGHRLLDESAMAALRRELFPIATVITPGVRETEALAWLEVRSIEDAESVRRGLLAFGPAAVLIKGGGLLGDRATDVLVTEDGCETVQGEWIETGHTRGTGCAYSAAIATHLARGRSLSDAVRLSKGYVTEAIRSAISIGQGTGPNDHLFYLRGDDAADWMGRLRLDRSGDE